MVVDRDIPKPKSTGKRGRPPKYPFSKMEVGDSAFFPGEKTLSNTYMAAANIGNRKGWKFSSRAVEGGIRIWRVE